MSNDKKYYKKRFTELEQEATDWKKLWAEVAEYTLPRSGRYLTSNTEQRNDGKKKRQQIINGIGADVIQIISASIQGGLTSPARPWFALSSSNEKLSEIGSVKEWLHIVQKAIMRVLSRSNFYNSLHQVYAELANFGVCPMLIEEDEDTIIRCRPFTIGEYYLSLNSKYRVDTMYRQFTMTARQMVEKFGEDKVSATVKRAFKNDMKETDFEIIHVIEPNNDKVLDNDTAEGMEYSSIYFEKSGKQDKFLRKSGYNIMPFVAPRWSVVGTDTYGDSPGINSLGDLKQLQKMEKLKLQAIEKEVFPAMNAPTALKREGVSVVAGDVNYIDMGQGNQGITPTYQIKVDLQNLGMEIQNVENRIRRSYFNDLFLSMFAQDKRMTATEVNERSQERLLILGSVIERIQSEMLDIIIDRVFDIMYRKGLIPPPPQELQGSDLKVEYISMLAQAQKMVGVTAIEQIAGFVGNLAAANPAVLDKLDFDQAVDEYAEMVGVPPAIIRSDDNVAKIRQAQQQQAAQMQQQEMLANSIQGAKTLSETKMNENNALDALMGNQIQQ